ncbi:MAG: hypothetical protein FWG46_04125 [Treponema sp.]|nr:hypothetical protein [Treponema sp.]
MAEFRFDVDTTPMARSVDGVKDHIRGVNGAVVAMQAAVIASERQASQKICDNVDEGFYMLVKSQISQKAVAAYTEMTARQMTLLQLAKALDGIRRQMEGDYSMITRRYAKLFQSLNKALETRVKEIDRPAMQLAETKKSIVFDKLKDDSSALFSISSEALPLAQTALSGKLKLKTKETLLTLGSSIEENRSYSEKVESILEKTETDCTGDSDRFYLPAIFLTTDSLLNTGDSIENIYTAQTDAWQKTVPVVSEINRIHNSLKWMPCDEGEKNKIRQEFAALCESELPDERIINEALRLFDTAAWEECRNELQ